MDLNLLLLFAVAGLATFLIRLSFIALLGRMAVPVWVRRILPYVPTAALTAIIVPELLMRGEVVFVSVSNSRLLAGLLACAIAWRTRNAFLTIGAGMLALWVLTAILERG
jgi:branched-subunit amino acid transport protein